MSSNEVNISIRGGREEDFFSVIQLIQEFSEFQKMPEKMSNSVSLMKTEKEYFHCFVAETGKSEIIGYATYFYAYFTWTGKSLYMDDLYVKPEFRGRGIGKKLMQAVFNVALEGGCKKVRWQVSQWNKPAIAFYKSLGAQIDDTELNCDLWFD